MGRTDRHITLLSWHKAIFRVMITYAAGFVIVIGALLYFSKNLPSLEQLQNFDPELTTRIYSSDGVVLQELHTQRRIFVPLEKIPPEMVNAVISIEDARFLNHWGVSVRDNLRAAAIDILTLSKKQGASTLTQQLARMLYESIGTEKTISRKIREFITAIQIEKLYTKSEIVEMYINTCWMGAGVYGVQAAAKQYFNKPASELTVDECALLAGVIKNSVRFSPLFRPESAFQRRNLVLKMMMEYGFLSAEEYALYKNSPLQVREPYPPAKIAPYFVEYVKQQLRREKKRLQIDVDRDGLSIYTTLDSGIQALADSALSNHLKHQQVILNRRLLENTDEIESILKDSTLTPEQVQAMIRGEVPLDSSLKSSLTVQGALIAIDPGTGKILAMIGGRDFRESQFNRATQARRQPGSVFKPIVYATVIDNGFPISTQLLNQPVVLSMHDGTRWAPKNYDLSTSGNTTLREGLRKSLNLISVRIVQELISPSSVVETARRMHITTPMPAVDAIALGPSGVIPIEITSAYGILANHGVWVEPIPITHIDDRYGNIIAEYSPKQDLVFSEETAYIMTNLLETVINDGTGKNSRRFYSFYQTAAGKTGTTNNFSDAWFVGYTPYIVTGVWVGIDNPGVSLGDRQSGAVAALPAWANFMREVHKKMNWKDKKFKRPPGIIEVSICRETKLLPSKYCPVETELFTKRTVPTEHCPIHTEISEHKRKDRVIF